MSEIVLIVIKVDIKVCKQVVVFTLQIQGDLMNKSSFLWGDLKFNIFYKGFLYQNRIYPYNHTPTVENLILSTKCKKNQYLLQLFIDKNH